MWAPDCASRSDTTAARSLSNCSPVKSILIRAFSKGRSSKMSRTRSSPSAIEFLRIPPLLLTVKATGLPSLRLASALSPSVTKLPNEPAPTPPFRNSPSSLPITTSSSATLARYGSSIFITAGSSGMLASISVSMTLALIPVEPSVAGETVLLLLGEAGDGSVAARCCASPLADKNARANKSSDARQNARAVENVTWLPVTVSYQLKCPINFSLSGRHDKLKLIGHQTDPYSDVFCIDPSQCRTS